VCGTEWALFPCDVQYETDVQCGMICQPTAPLYSPCLTLKNTSKLKPLIPNSLCDYAMSRVLRQPTRKEAAGLPQNAKFSFLSQASQWAAERGGLLALSSHLGSAALKVNMTAFSEGMPPF
jgi:hypothetical protein